MPGICGYHNVTSHVATAGLAERMLSSLTSDACQIVDRHVDNEGRFALGRASLGILSNQTQPAVSTDGRWLAVLDGEQYDTDRLTGDLERQGLAAERKNHAAMLLAAWASGGQSAVAAIEGSFAAAIVDTVNDTVTLISDRFGTRPIYYSHSAHRFCFASRMSAVLADEAVARDLDFNGISQFFTFGHYLGNSTSLAAVKLLPAAAVLVFDARKNKRSIRRYWAGSDRIGERPKNRQAALEAIDEALVTSVRKRQLAGATVGLSLSGGLDARTILGSLDHSHAKVKTVCLGMRGSRDHEASTALARIVGCKHHNHILDTVFLNEFSSHLENMVRLTDGQYLSQCIVMPTLPLYRQLEIGVLLRGHAGELLHMSKAYNFSLDNSALRLRSDADLEEWLWRRLKAYIRDGVDGPLFAVRDLEQFDASRASLRQALAETPLDETPAKRIVHLFLDQRVRRETMLSLMKFRSVVEPRLPYLDRALVEQLLAMPVEWQLGDELQTYILQKRQPRFCSVENTNTGAALGVGTMRKNYARLKMRIFSKLGMPGYQPYERLGLWLRRELAEVVRSTLLSEQCLSRGVFRPDTLRHVIERHLSGQRNHTYLILAALVFERGHRWLLDEVDDSPSDSRVRDEVVLASRGTP